MDGITHITTEAITTDITTEGIITDITITGTTIGNRTWVVGVNGRAGYYRYW